MRPADGPAGAVVLTDDQVATLGAGKTPAVRVTVNGVTVPARIDLGVFDVVDVSAQDYDGNPAHKQSMLRGPLN